jgi:hypothetical protein
VNSEKETLGERFRPMVLRHQSVRFETAQSWNKGHGNRDHTGTGNDGIKYPLDPYDGPRPKPGF